MWSMVILLLILETGFEKPRIVVADFKCYSTNMKVKELAKGIPELLTLALTSRGKGNIDVVERAELKRIIGEMKLGLSGLVDEKTMVKIGKMLGANMMVAGGVYDAGEYKLKLTSRLINIEKAKVEQTYEVESSIDNVFDAINELAEKIIAFWSCGLKIDTYWVKGKVFINGKYVGITPISLSGITPGTYDIEIKRSGYSEVLMHVVLNKGEIFKRNILLVPPSNILWNYVRLKHKDEVYSKNLQSASCLSCIGCLMILGGAYAGDEGGALLAAGTLLGAIGFSLFSFFDEKSERVKDKLEEIESTYPWLKEHYADVKNIKIGCILEQADEGAKIIALNKDYPGYLNGLKIGDVIVKVNGKRCSLVEDVIRELRRSKNIVLTVKRGENIIDIPIKCR